MTDPRFAHSHYTVRQKALKLFGASFYILGPDEQTVLFSKQKAFKLREDIRLYESEAMQQELIAIRTEAIIDFSAAYQVIDSRTQELIGQIRRKGWSSIVRDAWEVLDPRGQVIGQIVEDSGLLAVLRRLIDFMQFIAPQSYYLDIGGAFITFKQNRNPFIRKLQVDFTGDPQHRLDRRLGLAAAVLLSAVEGRQDA